MALPVGSQAPDFALSTKSGGELAVRRLSENFGRSNTVLLFFPMAFTSVCTSELCSVTQGLDQYEKLGATVFGISGDSPFSQEAWAKAQNITVPLLSDYDHRVAQAYDVAYEAFAPAKNLPMGGVAKRSAFVVDRSGTIQYSESSDDPRQLPNLEAIQAKLQELA